MFGCTWLNSQNAQVVEHERLSGFLRPGVVRRKGLERYSAPDSRPSGFRSAGGSPSGERILGSSLPVFLHVRHTWAELEAAAKATQKAEIIHGKAGIEGGMNRQIHFTGAWKIMNMQKLGTVSQSRKPLQLIEKPIESMFLAIHYANN